MKLIQILLFLWLIGALSCRKEPTSWDSSWNVILLQDTLNLNHLVVEELVGVNSDGSYHLLINRDLLNLDLDDFVSLPDTIIEQVVNIPLSISVPPGVQFIDQIENNTFNFQGLQLKHILLNDGKATVKISSPIGTKCIVTLKLPGVKKNGTDFIVQAEVEPGSVANPSVKEVEVDLNGYEIDLRGINGSSYNIIQSQFQVMTDPDGVAVNVSPAQKVKFQVRFSSLKPSYARGYFGNRVFEEIQDIRLDFMNHVLSGAIDVDDVNLKLTIQNGIKVGARAKLNQLQGENELGSVVSLNHPQVGFWIWVNQALGTWDNIQPFSHEINLTSTNSNIEDFIELLPRILRVNFAFEINPYGNTSGGWDELFSTSFVRARLTADMPLAIGMNNLTLCDTFDLKFSETGSVIPKSGSIKLKTFNSFSFGGTLSLKVLDADNQVLLDKTSSGSILGSSSLNNYAPMAVIPSETTFVFDDEEMKKLSNMKHIVLTAVFNSPNNGQIAQIYSGQFLAFQLFSNLRLRAQF
jgi:hypothetical protein